MEGNAASGFAAEQLTDTQIKVAGTTRSVSVSPAVTTVDECSHGLEAAAELQLGEKVCGKRIMPSALRSTPRSSTLTRSSLAVLVRGRSRYRALNSIPSITASQVASNLGCVRRDRRTTINHVGCQLS